MKVPWKLQVYLDESGRVVRIGDVELVSAVARGVATRCVLAEGMSGRAALRYLEHNEVLEYDRDQA